MNKNSGKLKTAINDLVKANKSLDEATENMMQSVFFTTFEFITLETKSKIQKNFESLIKKGRNDYEYKEVFVGLSDDEVQEFMTAYEMNYQTVINRLVNPTEQSMGIIKSYKLSYDSIR